MAYLVLDLEWNMGQGGRRLEDTPIEGFTPPFNEIVQIGATLCDLGIQPLSCIDLHIKSQFYQSLNPYVAKVTGLDSTDLQEGLPFPKAWSTFQNWLDEHKLNDTPILLLSWADADTKVLIENLKHYDLPTDLDFRVLDLQRLYTRLIRSQDNKQPALTTALHQVGLQEDETLRLHDAAVDAHYTAQILQALLPYLREFGETKSVPVRELPVSDIAQDLRKTRNKQAAFTYDEAKSLYSFLYSLGYLPSFRYKSQVRLPFRKSIHGIYRHVAQLTPTCPGCGEELRTKKPWNQKKPLRWTRTYRCPKHGKVLATVKIGQMTLRTGPKIRDEEGDEIPREGEPGYKGRLTLKIPKPF